MKIRYGGVNLHDKFECTVVKRPLPEFRATGSAISGVDGEIFESVNYGTREVVISVYAIDRTRRGIQYAARDLMSILNTHEEKYLCLGDERDEDKNLLYRKAVPSGTFDFQQFIHAGSWEIKFKQFDPFLYGKERVEQLMTLNQWHSFSAGGNVEAFPIIKAKPIGNTFTIEKYGGEHITFKGDISGKMLTINMFKQTVKVDPTITTGDGLQIGSRFFSIDGGVALRANCTTVVTWYERWL